MQPFWPQQIWAENGGVCPFTGGGAGSPPNTMWPGPRPTCMPSFILISPTVWLQCTNVTDRTDRQRTDSIGRTVLQTVAQKIKRCDVTQNTPHSRVIYCAYASNKNNLHIKFVMPIHSIYMMWAPKFKNGSRDPNHAHLGVVCLTLTWPTYLFFTFEDSSITHIK